MTIKGYVVRGRDRRDNVVTGDGIETIDAAVRATRTLAGCTDVAIFRVRDDGTEERLPSYEEAQGALGYIREEAQAALDHKRPGGMSVGGPPLLWQSPPSVLKELLRLTDGAAAPDPLASLEAAERRLLESAGWREGDPGFWIDPDDGTQWPRAGAIDFVRRKAGTK